MSPVSTDLHDFARSIPVPFRQEVQERGPDPDLSGADWLTGLPGWIGECADRWGLVAEGPVWNGVCAVVVPCLRGRDRVVLKLSWPHPEARHEHLALRAWDGVGAVRLLAADPSRWALLLEPLQHDRCLDDIGLLEACETIGGLMRQLDRPAPPSFTRLSPAVDRWTARCAAGSPLVPRRLVEQVSALLPELAQDCDGHLVHQDLHFQNVLAAERAPWLAIDPKPVSGEWAFAVAPVLWNRWPEALAAHNLRTHLRLRLAVVAEAAGIAEERAVAWSLVRFVTEALAEATEPRVDQDALSQWITLAKAMTS